MVARILTAVAQIEPGLGQMPRNLEICLNRMRKAASQGVRLVIFPECALTGYGFESLEHALSFGQSIPGPATTALTHACRELCLYIVIGMLERPDFGSDRLYNACALIGPEGIVGSYRKIHLPYLGVDRFTMPGDRPFQVYSIVPAGSAEPFRVGLHICYDSSFPESARVMALAGADLLALPTNWPPGSESAAAHLVNTRALENHVYYAVANRVGLESGFRYIGLSKIADPAGQTLAEAPGEVEALLVTEIEPAYARAKRVVRVPGRHEIHRIRDRRPEFYGPLVEPVAGRDGERRWKPGE